MGERIVPGDNWGWIYGKARLKLPTKVPGKSSVIDFLWLQNCCQGQNERWGPNGWPFSYFLGFSFNFFIYYCLTLLRRLIKSSIAWLNLWNISLKYFWLLARKPSHGKRMTGAQLSVRWTEKLTFSLRLRCKQHLKYWKNTVHVNPLIQLENINKNKVAKNRICKQLSSSRLGMFAWRSIPVHGDCTVSMFSTLG